MTFFNYIIFAVLFSISIPLNLTIHDYDNPSATHILDTEMIDDVLIVSGMISIVIPLILLQNPNNNSSQTMNNPTSLNLFLNNKFNTNFFEKLILPMRLLTI